MEGTEPLVAKRSFTVSNVERFNIKFPDFREPTELGSYCLDGSRKFVPGKGETKYLFMPEKPDNVRLDLNAAHTIQKGFLLDEKIDNLLRWIAQNRKLITQNEVNAPGIMADFVCFRGLLTAILCTPYEDKEPWIICATKFHKTIYLCQFDTEQKKERESSMSERERVMSSWGYKFEQYLTTTQPGKQPDTSVPVNENEESCCVVRTRLHSHSVIYGAEMDCEEPSGNDTTDMKRFVELKTSRHITSARQDRNFRRFKLLKWWAQSFLIGTRQIVCGFRNDSGIVQRLQTFNVADISKSAREFWQPNVCMNFCDQFLSYIKTIVQKDDKNVVYKFELRPGFDIVWEELSSSSSPFHFLPAWYTR